MSKIKLLPSHVIKQIAAGEVIESPVTVIKELIENSIDAHATTIEVSIRDGGKSFISIRDNGEGILKEDLRNTLSKHATSKLDHHNLYDIQTMGFRGEALFSIAYMSKITIKSRALGCNEAYEISAENEYIGEVQPSNLSGVGTYIEVRDLFFSFPARLKFLKSSAAETNAITKLIDALAIAHPHIGFKLYKDGYPLVSYTPAAISIDDTDYSKRIQQSLQLRVGEVLGTTFIDNALFFYSPSDEFVVYGYTSIPTHHLHNSSKQFFFVNKRYVKDKNFFGTLKGAYSGLMPNGKHPLAVIFIDINPHAIDVNVSPAKTEVKFSDPEGIKSFIIRAIKQTLKTPALQKTSSELSHHLVNSLLRDQIYSSFKEDKNSILEREKVFDYRPISLQHHNFKAPTMTQATEPQSTESATLQVAEEVILEAQQVMSEEINHGEDNPFDTVFQMPRLGYAKAQCNQNWIIAENNKGLVIVDQHAAHERITYEKLYQQFVTQEITTTTLLIPQVINLAAKEIDLLLSFKSKLQSVGLSIDKFGNNAIIVREYPKILGENVNFKDLIVKILVDLKAIHSPDFFLNKLREVIATMACHQSIRAGDNLSLDEMNALLRQIELTDNSAACPHGRPTYIEVEWGKVERLFSRR